MLEISKIGDLELNKKCLVGIRDIFLKLDDFINNFISNTQIL